MDAKEKMTYLDDLKNWSENDYPELCKITNAWEACNLKSFDDGLQLLSAFSNSHPFITSALQGDARRYIRRINDYINQIKKQTNLDKILTRESSDKTDHIAVVPAIAAEGANGQLVEYTEEQLSELVSKYTDNERPQHIAEYKHLLSPALQAETEKISALRAAIAKHSELAKALSDKGVKESTVKVECEKAVAYDKQLTAIYDACDAEYNTAVAYAKKKADEQAVSQVNATEGASNDSPESKQATEIDPNKKKGTYTKAEIDSMEDGSFQGECKAARINADKTYIKRKDVKDKSALAARLQELVEWGEMTQDDADAKLLASEVPAIEIPKVVAPGGDTSDGEGAAQ